MAPIPGEPDTFKLTRLVEEDDVPLELDGTTARLFVQQIVVVQDARCRTESYIYRLQTDASPKSSLIRWDYVREPVAHRSERAEPCRVGSRRVSPML